ncbi:MAG: ATP-binding protein, partial [Nitrospirae bacterium]
LRTEPPFSQWRYVTFDDLEVVGVAKRQPMDILALADNLVIDEVQKVPEFLSYVKIAVDTDPSRRFILSGSSHLLLMKSVSESLAGRATYYVLLPFTLQELKRDLSQEPGWLSEPEKKQACPFKETLQRLLLKGFLPPVYLLTGRDEPFRWWQGYVSTYLERDLRDIAQINYLPDFRRLMVLLSHRTGQILQISSLARDLGLPQTTLSRYIHLLEVSGLLIRLPSFTRNRAKRLLKSPKVYFLDPGLSAYLMGYSREEELSLKEYSYLFENLVFLNLYHWAQVLRGKLYYFRTYGGREKEVDFVLEVKNRVYGIEVKYKDTVDVSDAETLRFFRDVTPGFKKGFVFYKGNDVIPLGRDILALPWWYL